MQRLCLALAVGVLLLLVTGVGTATAAPPVFQEAGQGAESDQDAGAAAGTAQEQPTNSNTSVRVLSPGDEGDVSQTNEATSDATATNLNATDQSADQTQSGGGLQAIGQSAENDQAAFAIALTTQKGASNENAPVRVLSENEGDGGEVTQENTASSDATAGNANLTSQDADQTQSGSDCKCGSDGKQLIGQEADNDQKAAAIAATEQEKPSNTNISVRVLSPGDDGDVSQTNEATSDATAGNLNATKQTADQAQSGGDCKCSHGGTQVIGQEADSDQKVAALAATKQEKPSNKNISVRVLSDGDDGDVTQTNTASSDATAGNVNLTGQHADQTQGSGSGDQTIGQSADSDQKALAGALTVQEKPSNENISVRVLSPGDGGSVTQTNTASSNATAGNINATKQTADQAQTGDPCKCKGGGEQLIGQSAKNDQEAAALAATIQEKPSNTNQSVRVLSKGDDGDVEQKNKATSNAEAGNLNFTKQDADQTQAGGSGSQTIGQSAKSDQDAFALGLTVQKGASNENAPVRVLSKGDSGDVEQTNKATSDASAGNLNVTEQHADQTQTGDSCKCKSGGEQLIGQSAKNDQEAVAIAATFQIKPTNTNAPTRVLSKGDDGDVEQENEASSNATAGNLNATKQTADQTQAGGSGSQTIGQSAKNDQEAAALAATFQIKPANTNEPVRVLSKGDGGSVDQDNEATSNAEAGNLNFTKQDADQTQGGDCKCSHGKQLIGQSADSDQDAAAIAATFQVKPSNTNAPVRVLSKGDDGDVEQENEASSSATAANLNGTKQDATQTQSGSGLQVIGQAAKNEQDAFALGLTFQVGASNENAPVRVLSKGDGGSVSQSNVADSDATAVNSNWTDQYATQTQGGNHCCGTGIQAVGQLAKNEQGAVALALTAQLGHKQPCVCGDKGSIGNSNEPIRVKSPGDDGHVQQDNVATSSAAATNWNAVKQAVQEIQAAPCLCKEPGIQAVGQLDDSKQFAVAGAAGLQLDPKNAWAPDRKESPGHTGGRTQVEKKDVHDDAGSRSLTDQWSQRMKR
jgi:hypothetical protein